MPEQPLQRLVRRFFWHVMAAGQGAAPRVGRVVAFPHREHVAVDTLGVAARAPDHQERNRDLAPGFVVGLVHAEVTGRAGTIVGAGANDRLPVEAADVLVERLTVEKAEADAGLRQFFSMKYRAGIPAS